MEPVLVLGGGLSGVGAAYALARAGVRDVTIVERGSELGGLAGTFEREGRFYPLAYHHILGRDRALLFFLDRIGALPRVRWRRISMLFQHDGRLWDLRRLPQFLRFPMSLADKLRLARLMVRSWRKSDWGDWVGLSAAELLDSWSGPGVREALFEPLTRLKFGLPCQQVSAAWLGARLHHREGAAPLGYVPGTNWTRVLCDGLAELLRQSGVQVRLRTAARRLHVEKGRARWAELDDGSVVQAESFVSALPVPVYRELAPGDRTPGLDSMRYTAIVSAVCATRQPIEPHFYWFNLTALATHACGLFRLDALNPTIGAPGEACLDFVTHLPGPDRPFFAQSDAEIEQAYRADFRRLFGRELEPSWMRISRLPCYSPVFDRGFRNPPIRSASYGNVYFAGNYRTFPSVASTGTALASGLEAAQAILAETGRRCDLLEAIRSFRLRSAPRG
jgi:protoporphyrinogen oxidase